MIKLYYRKSDGYLCNRYPYDIPVDKNCDYYEIDENSQQYMDTFYCECFKTWAVKDNKLQIIFTDKCKYEKYKKDLMRLDREDLLDAYDKLKASVVFGDTTLNDYEKAKIKKWYHDILDLKSESFTNVPDKVKYYIKKNV